MLRDNPDYGIEVSEFKGGLFIDSYISLGKEGDRLCGPTIIIPPKLLKQFLKDIQNASSTI